MFTALVKQSKCLIFRVKLASFCSAISKLLSLLLQNFTVKVAEIPLVIWISTNVCNKKPFVILYNKITCEKLTWKNIENEAHLVHIWSSISELKEIYLLMQLSVKKQMAVWLFLQHTKKPSLREHCFTFLSHTTLFILLLLHTPGNHFNLTTKREIHHPLRGISPLHFTFLGYYHRCSDRQKKTFYRKTGAGYCWFCSMF